MINCREDKWIGRLICVLLLIACYLLYAYAHYVNDDYYYLYPFYEYKSNGGDLILGDVLNWLKDQINLNLRLSNQISILILLLPHFVCDILSVLMTVLLVFGMMRLLKIKRLNSLSMMLLISLVVYVLPWYDQMFCVNFRINYVWSSAIVILFLERFLSNNNSWTSRQKISFICLALIASVFHEGATTPLLIGIIVQYLVSKQIMSRVQKVSLLILLIGILVLLFTPGFTTRIEDSLQWRSVKSYVMYMCSYNIISTIFILFVVWGMIKGYYRKMIVNKVPLYLISSFVGCGIFMISPVIRASWFPSLYSIIGLIIMLRDVFEIKLHYNRKFVYFFGYGVLLIHLIMCCYYSKIIYTEWSTIASNYEKRAQSNFFTPITLEKDIPLITLGKAYGFRHQCWGNNIMSQTAAYYRVDRDILAVPEILRKIDKKKLRKVVGNNPFYWYGHYILMPKGILDYEHRYMVKIRPLTMFNIEISIRAKVMYIEFTTDLGESYYLVATNYQALQPIFDNVVEINR